MKPVKLLVLLGLAVFGLSGCYRYACPAPEGTTCKSISQIYKENDAGTLGKKANRVAHQDRKKRTIAREISAPAPEAPFADNPRKGEFEEEIKVSAPLVLPIKIYRYIDSDGDLHHPGFVFVMINTPGWGNSDEKVEMTAGPVSAPYLSQSDKKEVPSSGISTEGFSGIPGSSTLNPEQIFGPGLDTGAGGRNK